LAIRPSCNALIEVPLLHIQSTPHDLDHCGDRIAHPPSSNATVVNQTFRPMDLILRTQLPPERMRVMVHEETRIAQRQINLMMIHVKLQSICQRRIV
jgi:hypothetical protein